MLFHGQDLRSMAVAELEVVGYFGNYYCLRYFAWDMLRYLLKGRFDRMELRAHLPLDSHNKRIDCLHCIYCRRTFFVVWG